MSPIDTNIITLFLQNILIAASGAKESQIDVSIADGNRFLVRLVDCTLRRCFEIEFNLMFLSVIGGYFIRDIVDRT